MPQQRIFVPKSQTNQKRLPIILMTAFGVTLLILFAVTPQLSISGAKKGLLLSAQVLIPSFFPFLAIAGFLIESGLPGAVDRVLDPFTRKVFRLPGCTAAAFLVGVLTGYPVGAKFVTGLYQKGLLSKDEAERSLCFCINSGAAFVIGSVGIGILHNVYTGFLIYAAHIFSSLIIAFITRFSAKKHVDLSDYYPAVEQKSFSQKFVQSVSDAGSSMIQICAFVILFSAITSVLQGLHIITALSVLFAGLFHTDAHFFESLLIGLIEVTNGCANAGLFPELRTAILMSGLLGFSGFCVHCQVAAAVSPASLSLKPYFKARLAHALLSVGLIWFLLELFPKYIPTMAIAHVGNTDIMLTSAPASIALLFFVAILLLSDIRTGAVQSRPRRRRKR